MSIERARNIVKNLRNTIAKMQVLKPTISNEQYSSSDKTRLRGTIFLFDVLFTHINIYLAM